jgi:DNA (cytosine-5)-methyltransferase 1
VKLGSLFDGIGGWPLAGLRHGIKPVWASEIEKFPIEVTEKHFPDMKHLGDLTKINGAEIDPVDVITFGSPCQDLSVAGKRAGLEGSRSGLFMEAVRIIREMRDSTDGKYPRFAIWENVPGAFSSNKGDDFRAVLEEIAEAKIPMPQSGKWAPSGMVGGNGVEIAWRVLDAQYWGVPQRRKRIFLVADFGGCCAGEILFKPESVSRDIETCGGEGEGVARGAEVGVRSIILFEPRSQDGVLRIHDNVCPTLNTAQGGQRQPCIAYSIAGNVIDRKIENGGNGKGVNEEVSFTLNTIDRYAVAYSFDSLSSNSMKSKNPHSGCREVEVAKCIDTTYPCPSKNQGGIAIVGYTPTSFAQYQEGVGTLKASGGDCGHGSETIITSVNCVEKPFLASGKPAVDCLMANCGTKQWLGNQEAFSGDYHIINNYKVRRLTPTECERLQGLPDGYTAGGSDTQRYKALGNGMAQPCPDYVMEGIANILCSDRE